MIYSAFWWFLSVVVVSILTNIASTYLFPHFDKQLEKYSAWHREQNVKKKAYIDKEISYMVADPSYLIWYTALYNTNQIHIVSCFIQLVLFAACLLVIASIDNLSAQIRIFLTVFIVLVASGVLILLLKRLSQSGEIIYITEQYLSLKRKSIDHDSK